MSTTISLTELNHKIKESINQVFPGKYYVTAEISEINESRGHAYLELIEKDESDQLTAKVRATVWAKTFRMLKPYFETTTGHKLESGLMVLIVVNIEFHEVYGFSLNILDIDPKYTIGDIEQKRLAIIRRLEEEGIIEMNKELDLPSVVQRIAVISSESAAGYGDFIDQLDKNEYGYIFYYQLFSSAMQGDETELSVINALEKIFEIEEQFDVVVIIRGGGSKSDLSWFDSYNLALNIAQFPLPVITGIGHERDTTIADMVSYMSLKTPTAVAEFLVGRIFEFDSYIENLKLRLSESVNSILSQRKADLEMYISDFKPIILESILNNKASFEMLKLNFKNSVTAYLSRQETKLNDYPDKMFAASKSSFQRHFSNLDVLHVRFENTISNTLKNNNHKLEVLSNKRNLLDPESILKRGFSLSTIKGKIIKSVKQVKTDDIIETNLIDGSFKSKVEN